MTGLASRLERLDADERRVLGDILGVFVRLGRAVPLDVWRFLYSERGERAERSAALERLRGRWALVGEDAPPALAAATGDDSSAAGEDPDALRRAVLEALPTLDPANDPADDWANDPALWPRLAAAAEACGAADLAVDILDQADSARHASPERSRPERSRAPNPRAPNPRALKCRAPSPRASAALERPTFRLGLLGPPSVTRLDGDGGEHEVHWRLHRSLLALARLALAPDHRLARDELVEALWPFASVDHVRRNFHPTLSATRRALWSKAGAKGGSASRGGGIVQRHGIYGLDPEVAWWIDVETFEAHLERASELEDAEASLSELEAAWRLYRGPLLDGFEAEWIDEPRRRQHRHYLDMLRRLGDSAAALGRETLALDAYRRLLLDEPFEERIHVELMEIYGRRGRRDLVRRQFVHLQELLKDLHAEPAEETVERYHQLMR